MNLNSKISICNTHMYESARLVYILITYDGNSKLISDPILIIIYHTHLII